VKIMPKTFRLVLILVLMAWAATASAGVFVDWRAGFRITYPDNWQEVDFSEVYDFLDTQGLRYDFDVVLARKIDKPFFTGAYAFVSYRGIGNLDNSGIDSVLLSISREYGKMYKTGSLRAVKAQFGGKVPVYDPELGAVATQSRISTPYGEKILLDIRKFYKRGVAEFLCYAHADIYPDMQPVFLDFLSSFSTENLREFASRDSITVVDLSERQGETTATDDDDSSGGTSAAVIIVIALAAALAGIYGIKRKK